MSLDPPPRAVAQEHACALERLALSGEGSSVLVVAAHPDDETIGVGAMLGSLVAMGWRVHIVHVTDGAPRDPSLRPTLGRLAPSEAAAVRRSELAAALRVGGLDPDVVLLPSLGVPDQEAALAMVEVARALSQRLVTSPPSVVITHPYEGGHPDHDSVAFAVHAAARVSGVPVRIAEMSSYHAASGRQEVESASFVPGSESSCAARHDGLLDVRARRRKRAMLDAFASQVDVLASFGTLAEPLRCAPAYDFTRPPHPGTLNYERLAFGWTGDRWRELARAALKT